MKRIEHVDSSFVRRTKYRHEVNKVQRALAAARGYAPRMAAEIWPATSSGVRPSAMGLTEAAIRIHQINHGGVVDGVVRPGPVLLIDGVVGLGRPGDLGRRAGQADGVPRKHRAGEVGLQPRASRGRDRR